MTTYIFRIEGKVKPYVRMTQRSRWKDRQAQEYKASQAAIKLQLRARMALQGWETLPARTPLDVTIAVFYADHGSDLDNICKAILDAANGIVWPDDRWVDAISIRRMEAEKGQEHVNFAVTSLEPLEDQR